MPKFRKKPVEIEAIRVSDALKAAANDWSALPQWLIDAYENRGDPVNTTIVFETNQISISTLEGVMIGGKDDWIIRGVKGELYPCKPDIFEATYDAA